MWRQVPPGGLGCLLKQIEFSQVLRPHPRWRVRDRPDPESERDTDPAHKKKTTRRPREWTAKYRQRCVSQEKTFDGFLPAMQRTGRTKKPPSGTMNGATRWRAGRPSGAWCGCPLNAAVSTAASHRRTRTIRSDASLSLAAGGRNSLKFGAKFKVRDSIVSGRHFWHECSLKVKCFSLTERQNICWRFGEWIFFWKVNLNIQIRFPGLAFPRSTARALPRF